MAKKTVAKKPKRRLKRTARRSLAAVLMITAIVVAAIPVPENMAEDGSSDLPTSAQTSFAYVPPSRENDEYLANRGGEHSCNGIKCSESNILWKDNPTGDLPQELEEALKEGGGLRASVRAKQVDNRIQLTWEFLYHINGKGSGPKTAVLCKYNPKDNRGIVEVRNFLCTDYQAVPTAEFEKYFTNPKAYNDKTNNPMDNLKVGNSLYPTTEIVYSVDYWDIDSDQKDYLAKYYKVEYDQVTSQIERVNRGEQPAPNLATSMTKIVGAGLSDPQMKEFYCEHNKVLNQFAGISFELVPADDYRVQESGEIGNGAQVYLAKCGTTSTNLGSYGTDDDGMTLNYVTDVDGYLTKEGTAQVTTIGERAFAGVENVQEIIIPEAIAVIGDRAFEGSTIKSVTLNNHTTVGNRTFYNCHHLTSVTFGEGSGITQIGAEAFYGCSALTQVKFPTSMRRIGYGAFANCHALTNVDFSGVKNEGCVLEAYAFYDDAALTDRGLNFAGSSVVALGKCCFALASQGGNSSMTEFTFPSQMTGGTIQNSFQETIACKIGEYVLANREKLTKVTMPLNYHGEVPSTTFYNCIGLHNVIFPNTCGAASFKPDLFAHVTDENFFVRGPELYDNDIALPRSSTWEASTRVSGDTGVPYVYEKDGRDCYEVAMKSGDNVYRYEIDSDGTLKSCVLVKEGKDSVDIVIPKKVGNYTVRSIGKGCFDNPKLRDRIRSITIQDDSITAIDDEAFAGLPNLAKVRIGNSVTQIGERAFANCNDLKDVYFNTPKAGYSSDSFKMAETAFQTGGSELTFHGDIVKGYAPFTYAMDPRHTLANTDRDTVTICYKSLWNSNAEGTHLTVMVDRGSNPIDPEVVLVDYPKLTDLSKDGISQDDELQDYCKDMERYYYDKVYDSDNSTVKSKGKTVGELRREYAKLLKAVIGGLEMADLNGDGVAETSVTDGAFEDRYGPWINERFLETDEKGGSNWANWLGSDQIASLSDTDTRINGNSIYNFFFEPIVVKAAETTPGVKERKKWLTPYFTTYPYNFMDNYNLMKNNPTGEGLDDYQTLGNAKHFIDGTETIIVPEGVTSIDVYRYQDSDVNPYNAYNYTIYQDRKRGNPRFIRDTESRGGAQPGLFSGYYEDYTDEDKQKDKNLADLEKEIKGNDVIKEVVLRSVKKLPKYAFDNCEQLKSVTLGAVEEIEEDLLPFRGCANMTELIGNANFPVEKGILFKREDSGKYKIIECLMCKGRAGTNDSGLEEKVVGVPQIALLKDVTEISKNAFEGCDNIVTVNLYGVDGLKEIPEGCFKDCVRLDDVILPVSVNKIKETAFEGITEPNGIKRLTVTIWGREVDIADNAFSPKNGVIIKSYLDSAARRYADRYNPPIVFVELGAYSVKFYDYDGTQIGATQEYQKQDGVDVTPTAPEEAKRLDDTNHRPGYKFAGWLGSNSKTTGIKITDKLDDDLTVFVAQYESTGGGMTADGKYQVDFYDMISGLLIKSYQIDAGATFAELEIAAPTHPEHAGYEPYGFSDNWTVNTVIDRNMSIIMLYKVATTSGGSTNTSGGTTTTSRNTTSRNTGNTSGNSSNTSNNSSNNTSSSSSTSTSSTSTTSATSGAGQYTVFVENGSGSGTYTPGATVVIQASIPAAGMRFDKWTTESNGVTLASVSMTATTFTMPSNNVTVKANYVADNTTATSTTGTGNTTDTTGNGNTIVDIQKPGISNRDLATATTNGSTDNFIVKISETDEATRAVAAALTNKYGTLDNILYYAMDISLYDSTGTTKITDTTGLSVDITIPIPDSLVAYGGNNMAGAVINGDQLESLNESFTTINGVPCIRFRATHFSPYTIYVDTGNLVEGMLDVTPKTGDPIHPKWFLSLGLACLSMILFLKRDKKIAVKA